MHTNRRMEKPKAEISERRSVSEALKNGVEVAAVAQIPEP